MTLLRSDMLCYLLTDFCLENCTDSRVSLILNIKKSVQECPSIVFMYQDTFHMYLDTDIDYLPIIYRYG